MLIARLAAPLLAALALLPRPVPRSGVLDDVDYGTDSATDPHFDEHVLDVIFPSGAGPGWRGWPEQPWPVVVYLGHGAFKPPHPARLRRLPPLLVSSPARSGSAPRQSPRP